MKKIFAYVLFFCLLFNASLFADESDDEFMNMIESTLAQGEKKEDAEVQPSYVEGLDDNTVEPSRKAQTDDTINDPYAEKALNVSEETSGTDAEEMPESFPLESEPEQKADEVLSSDESSEIVQSLYGVPEAKASSDEYDEDFTNIVVTIPEKKSPKKADSEKLSKAEKKDEDKSDFKEKTETLNYGTPSEISAVVDKVVEEDDPRFIDTLYDLFYATSSNDVRSKIMDYFAKSEDPCLCDYVVEILDDPYDESKSFVTKCIEYASKVHCSEAAPAFVKILEGENEEYFNAALSALGKTGGKKEAKYLAKYLERDDLEIPMRQALMRTLGQMNAVETWEQVVEIAQNEDENGFVRQYAAEALGNMKKEESIPILINLYENGDPNMREYCIKGLLNFPDSEKARNLILQGIRDDHVKVRLQSIKACREMKLKEAVTFLIYRAKNDNETSVKKESYPAIAELNTNEGNEYLISLLKEKKGSDSAKNMAAEALLKFGENACGVQEIKELALSVVEDDRRKPLRKAIGVTIAKNPQDSFAEVCEKYLESKDSSTVGLGIDMFKSGRYDSAKGALVKIAEAKSGNVANRKRARKLLGMEENPEEESKAEEKKVDAKNEKAETKDVPADSKD
ncbi:MAG: HEAT repeat domain-containing protein [Treponema sp.]|nr:HEAT repeat domain-containing protein [Treponema sp.]